jgi:hypothetical protein
MRFLNLIYRFEVPHLWQQVLRMEFHFNPNTITNKEKACYVLLLGHNFAAR